MNQSESFNQLTLPTLEYENKKMSLFGDVCETQFHYADFTEIGNYRTENTLNGEIEIYLDVQPLFDPNYNPLYVSNWKKIPPTQYYYVNQDHTMTNPRTGSSMFGPEVVRTRTMVI